MGLVDDVVDHVGVRELKQGVSVKPLEYSRAAPASRVKAKPMEMRARTWSTRPRR
ncbi:hypothetical protein PV371_38840 [Streptomyces sp. TX20-6-3]|uniref:hypothetical protein n=1 Tax=Streptomyces sp. TX20-6-3 TaxID=3028705 RepID=UPI0029A62B42|nr:hypothetical protein [Streptomyces sp. TX20-6-3]MDX2565465.1 hypothetical protein [Streptomyces sp. TX20-6-3]